MANPWDTALMEAQARCNFAPANPLPPRDVPLRAGRKRKVKMDPAEDPTLTEEERAEKLRIRAEKLQAISDRAKAAAQARKERTEERPKPSETAIRARKFGISEETLLALIEVQGGWVCAICSEVAIAIDHCHTSREVRGLLCTRCNLRILGKYQDDPARIRERIGILERAIEYLADPPARRAISGTARTVRSR